MELYVGVDLHSNNNYIGIINEEGEKVFQHKYLNDIETIKNSLIPFEESIRCCRGIYRRDYCMGIGHQTFPDSIESHRHLQI